MIADSVFLVRFDCFSDIVLRAGSIVHSTAQTYYRNVPTLFRMLRFSRLGLAVKYPRELLVTLLHNNFGVSIDRVHIRIALGWDVVIYGVLC